MKPIIYQINATTVMVSEPNGTRISYIQFPYFVVSQDLTVLEKLRSVKAVKAYALLKEIEVWGYIPHKNSVSYMYNHLKMLGYTYKNNSWTKQYTPYL